jgi:GT2 family glycosyltransferase
MKQPEYNSLYRPEPLAVISTGCVRVRGCVAAVIVTYNSAVEIKSCLNALLDQCGDLINEIVVVDNASEDGTCAHVKTFSNVRLLRNASNKGFAAAVNRGIKCTSSEYVLVLNPDVVVTAEAVAGLAESLRLHEGYAAVGCRLTYPDGRTQCSARRFPTLASFIGRVLLTNELARRFHLREEAGESVVPRMRNSSNGISEVDWILGACMMIRRAAYELIGPMDESYFLYYEDIDWCYRAHLCGWNIGFLVDPHVTHEYKRGSSRVFLGNRLMWVHLRSALYFFRKFAANRPCEQ